MNVSPISAAAHQALTPAITLRPLAATFGLEADLAGRDAAERQSFIASLPGLLAQHKVLVIRNAHLDRAALYGLGQQLGAPMRYAFSEGVEGFPELIEIHRTAEQKTALSTMWHSDSTYLATPPDATLLYGVLIPPFGGTTLFADTVAAFDDLSPAMRDTLRMLNVVQRSDTHANNERLAHLSKPKDNRAPLSAVHPAVKVSDGVEALYVSQEHTAHFDGMTREESQPLIDFVMRHIAADKYRLEIVWQPGTLVLFDNRKTIHRAIDNYYGHERTLWRLIVGLPSAHRQRVADPALLEAA